MTTGRTIAAVLVAIFLMGGLLCLLAVMAIRPELYGF